MKRIFIILLCSILLFMSIPAEAFAEKEMLLRIECVTRKLPTITKYKNAKSEEFLWNAVNKYSPSEILTAAILGYFWRESYYKSNAIAHWAVLDKRNKKDNSQIFTDRIDKGLEDQSSREYFLKQAPRTGGYGLGQWSSKRYIKALYDFAVSFESPSIADAEMQAAFTVWSIQHQHKKEYKELEKNMTLYTASLWMGYVYDGSSTASGVIYAKAKEVYEKMAK